MAEGATSQLLQKFRSACALDDEDHEYVSELGKYTERLLPARFKEQAQNSSETSSKVVLQDDIENIQQFYNWVDSLEGVTGTEEDEAYKLHHERLLLYSEFSSDILNDLDQSLESLDILEQQYHLVSTKTGELHQDCENLLQQQQGLVKFAEQVEEKLTYFNEVDDIQKLFTRPNLSVLDPNFIDALGRLDRSISFILENPSYQESRLYLMKFQQLQTRGLTMVKSYIVASLRNTGKNQSDEFETRAYIKFRALAETLRPLCQEIESRVQRKEYQSLLSDCHYCYFQQRNRLLYGNVDAAIRSFAQLGDLSAMIRSGCAYLIKICQSEYELYKQFFSSFSAAMRNLLEGFGDMLYMSLRPLFIRAQEVDILCSSAHILKSEILFTIEEKGESVQAFLGVINRMLEDIQERLIFLAQKFILDNICTFTPQKKDIDYPARLINYDKTNIYAYWYPTLEKTLMFLSRLYLSIDAKIFEGLAQETVSECCISLLYASRLITKNQGWIDGQLFLIQHLMILREQITPFDINFCITQKELDFSHMKDAFSSIFSGSFSWRRSSAPRVVENQVDSRKDLEKALDDSIHELCTRSVAEILDPLSSFVKTANSYVRVRAVDEEPLRDQKFASPESLKEIITKVQGSWDTLKPIVEKFRIYFNNQNNLVYMYDQLRDFILSDFKNFFQLLDTHYEPEDKLSVDLTLSKIRAQLEFEQWELKPHTGVPTNNADVAVPNKS